MNLPSSLITCSLRFAYSLAKNKIGADTGHSEMVVAGVISANHKAYAMQNLSNCEI